MLKKFSILFLLVSLCSFKAHSRTCNVDIYQTTQVFSADTFWPSNYGRPEWSARNTRSGVASLRWGNSNTVRVGNGDTFWVGQGLASYVVIAIPSTCDTQYGFSGRLMQYMGGYWSDNKFLKLYAVKDDLGYYNQLTNVLGKIWAEELSW